MSDPLIEIAAALRALAVTTSPEYTYSRDELLSFDWESIGAIPIENDAGQVIFVEWMGARWARVENDQCVSYCRPCAGMVLILCIFGNPETAGLADQAQADAEADMEPR